MRRYVNVYRYPCKLDAAELHSGEFDADIFFAPHMPCDGPRDALADIVYSAS